MDWDDDPESESPESDNISGPEQPGSDSPVCRGLVFGDGHLAAEVLIFLP